MIGGVMGTRRTTPTLIDLYKIAEMLYIGIIILWIVKEDFIKNGCN